MNLLSLLSVPFSEDIQGNLDLGVLVLSDSNSVIDWVAHKQQKSLTVLVSGKSKIKVTVDSVPGEGLLSGLEMPTLLCPYMGEERQRALRGLFYKGTNLIYEDSSIII